MKSRMSSNATRPAGAGSFQDGRATNGKTATILVVDDEEYNRKLLAALLAAEGHAIRAAASGEEALSSVAEQLPGLILLDIMMPGIDGFEVARRLKADPRTRPIPIVMVTALEDRESRMRALEAGAEDFLSKPVDHAELLARVRNLLRLKEYGDLLADHNCILERQVRERTTALRTLSACNVALVHARTEEELFQSACRHTVEIGGYLLAWVEYLGEADGNGKLRRFSANLIPHILAG